VTTHEDARAAEGQCDERYDDKSPPTLGQPWYHDRVIVLQHHHGHGLRRSALHARCRSRPRSLGRSEHFTP
jgi:hypothetical protein